MALVHRTTSGPGLTDPAPSTCLWMDSHVDCTPFFERPKPHKNHSITLRPSRFSKLDKVRDNSRADTIQTMHPLRKKIRIAIEG